MSASYIPPLAEFAYARLSFDQRISVGKHFGWNKFQAAKRCTWCNEWGAKHKIEDYDVGWRVGYPIICQRCFDEELITVPLPYNEIGHRPKWDDSLSCDDNDIAYYEWLDKKQNWQQKNGIEYGEFNAYQNPDGATYIWRLFDGS